MARQVNGDSVKTGVQKSFMSKPSSKQRTGKLVQHKAADCESVILGIVELLATARRGASRPPFWLIYETIWPGIRCGRT
jgi:hypothetical protein